METWTAHSFVFSIYGFKSYYVVWKHGKKKNRGEIDIRV